MAEGRKSTMVELVAELEALPCHTAEIGELIREARAGEYHDYKNRKYDCGKVEVVRKLRLAASLPATPRAARDVLKALAERVIAGEFDEEADEDDKAMMRKQLPEHMWPMFGLEPERTDVH